MTFGVTGFTAITTDMAEKLSEVFPIYMAIIVALSLLILFLVFRSITVPILATGGFVLSILATFGLTTLVFQDGWLKVLFGFDTADPSCRSSPSWPPASFKGWPWTTRCFSPRRCATTTCAGCGRSRP